MTTLACVAALLGMANSAPLAEVPFTLHNNHVFLEAKIDGVPIRTLLNTGSSATLIDFAVKRDLRLPAIASTRVGGAADGTASALILQNTNLQLGRLQLPVLAAMSLEHVSVVEGHAFAAMLGADVLLRYTVEIDYPNQIVRFYDPKGFVPAAGDAGMELKFANLRPHISATVAQEGFAAQQVQVMVDTGFSGTFALSQRGASLPGIRDRIARQVPVNRSLSPTGPVRARDAWIDAVVLAGQFRTGPLHGLANWGSGADTGAGSTYDLLIGGAVLKDYTVTFDLPNGMIYFRGKKEAERPLIEIAPPQSSSAP